MSSNIYTELVKSRFIFQHCSNPKCKNIQHLILYASTPKIGKNNTALVFDVRRLHVVYSLLNLSFRKKSTHKAIMLHGHH